MALSTSLAHHIQLNIPRLHPSPITPWGTLTMGEIERSVEQSLLCMQFVHQLSPSVADEANYLDSLPVGLFEQDNSDPKCGFFATCGSVEVPAR